MLSLFKCIKLTTFFREACLRTYLTATHDFRRLALLAAFIYFKTPGGACLHTPMINSQHVFVFLLQFLNNFLIKLNHLKCTKLLHSFLKKSGGTCPHRLKTSDTQCALSAAFLWLKTHGWICPRENSQLFSVSMYIDIFKLLKFNWKHF